MDEDEREPMFVQARDPDYVPEFIYPEYIPLEDEHEFPAEEQPLPPVDSPTAESLGHVTESDPEEDPEEYEDDETEDGLVDYPMDGGDDGDNDDGDSSRDDANDEDEDEEDEEDEEEEEHLALVDSTTVIPVDEPVFPPVIPPPSIDLTIGARITVRPQASISLPPETKVERLLAMTTPSPSPPISQLPPSARERLVRIASTQTLIDAVTAALPSPPLPPLPPSLYIPPPINRSRYEIGESSTARPTKGRGIDYGFVSMVDAEERRQGIRDVGYGIRDTWVDPAEAVPEIAPMTVGEVNTRVTELAELHEHDTQDLYALLEDAQDSRSRISQRVDMDSQRVDLLMGDRMTLQETVWMVEEEAYASREAWAHSIGLSQATHQELQTHRDHVYAHETHLQAHQTQLQLQGTLIQTQHQVHETRFQMQQTELAALRETDRRRQAQMVETLRVMRDMRREMSDMQAELLALREQQRRARQPGPEARIPDHQDASGDADNGSHSSHGDNQRNVQTVRPYFYTDFMKCQPLNFKGTEGMVGLIWWIEKMESVFNISGCAIKNQVKFATCTLLGAALTWWNGQIRTLGPEAYAMTWEVKGNDVPAYTEHFQELTLISTKFVANETEKVDKYISGLPDNIYGNVKSSRPKTQSDNKKKADDSSRNNHGHQQQPFKRQNVAKVYNIGTSEKKPYGGSLPKTFKRDCPKLKNKDGGNGNAQGWVYAVGNAEKKGNASGNPDSNVVMGTFLLNNHYASILFDTGADRSFMSTAFSSLIDIVPTSLDNSYDVKLVDGKIVGIDTIIRGCILNFLDHPFNIDLMPVELGSFDVIIGMDWLRRCHAVIVYDEKLVQVPYGNETLTFCGNESSNGRESRLTVISCSKSQEYMAKGCQVFLAQISAKKEEDNGILDRSDSRSRARSSSTVSIGSIRNEGIIFDPEEDIIENLLNLDKTKDLPPYHDNPLSGNPTPISEPKTKSSSSSHTLTSIEESELIWEEFEAYLARNDDLPFDAESDLREIEYLFNHNPIKEMDSLLEDSVDENSLDDNLVDTISEMFTDEHALDYSSPPL
ncbi:putative reverse transcriptase domain-containing protein [Tanacetum coccineum]